MRVETTTNNRKAMAYALAERLGAECRYMGTPTYAYRVGNLTIERDGAIIGEHLDLLAVTGNLNIGSATVDFAPLNSSLTGSPYIFATYGSLIGSQFASVVDLPGGYTIDYAYDNGTTTTNIALVPEPTVALLAGLGLLGLLRRRRA